MRKLEFRPLAEPAASRNPDDERQSAAGAPPVDRRQSPTALAIARGTARFLHALGYSVVSELPLPSGRRADLVALGGDGEILIVEIKSSVADFRADQKWTDYRLHCDRLFFATVVDVPRDDFPAGCRPDRRRRLRRLDRLRSARASPGGGAAQDRDAALCARRGAAPAGARRSARALSQGKSKSRARRAQRARPAQQVPPPASRPPMPG